MYSPPSVIGPPKYHIHDLTDAHTPIGYSHPGPQYANSASLHSLYGGMRASTPRGHREDRRTSRMDVPLKLPSTRTLLLTEISLFLLTLLIFKEGDSEGERLVKPSDKESPQDSLLADPTVSNYPAAGVVLVDPA
ncbi:hypothetical protein E4U14_004608 [Claviceps sp. LM454 group G7]|nr:hypothetical protein E4U14_004608 [Claviceps sp. LM454 group G7]